MAGPGEEATVEAGGALMWLLLLLEAGADETATGSCDCVELAVRVEWSGTASGLDVVCWSCLCSCSECVGVG